MLVVDLENKSGNKCLTSSLFAASAKGQVEESSSGAAGDEP